MAKWTSFPCQALIPLSPTFCQWEPFSALHVFSAKLQRQLCKFSPAKLIAHLSTPEFEICQAPGLPPDVSAIWRCMPGDSLGFACFHTLTTHSVNFYHWYLMCTIRTNFRSQNVVLKKMTFEQSGPQMANECHNKCPILPLRV